MPWSVVKTAAFNAWFAELPTNEQKRVIALEILLSQEGPGLGRPVVGKIEASRHPNMKELRRGSNRILFAFDPQRTAVLLVGGNKRGQWRSWYPTAVSAADRLFDHHLRSLGERDPVRHRRTSRRTQR